MLRVEREHRFDCSVEEGFAYITDIDNWPHYWPGFVRIEPGSRWSTPGDEAVMVVRLLGREVELRMTMSRLEPNQLVEYASSQPGLPDARHERHFVSDGGHLRYRLVVEYEPRSGFAVSTTGFSYGVASNAPSGRPLQISRRGCRGRWTRPQA